MSTVGDMIDEAYAIGKQKKIVEDAMYDALKRHDAEIKREQAIEQARQIAIAQAQAAAEEEYAAKSAGFYNASVLHNYLAHNPWLAGKPYAEVYKYYCEDRERDAELQKKWAEEERANLEAFNAFWEEISSEKDKQIQAQLDVYDKKLIEEYGNDKPIKFSLVGGILGVILYYKFHFPLLGYISSFLFFAGIAHFIAAKIYFSKWKSLISNVLSLKNQSDFLFFKLSSPAYYPSCLACSVLRNNICICTLVTVIVKNLWGIGAMIGAFVISLIYLIIHFVVYFMVLPERKAKTLSVYERGRMKWVFLPEDYKAGREYFTKKAGRHIAKAKDGNPWRFEKYDPKYIKAYHEGGMTALVRALTEHIDSMVSGGSWFDGKGFMKDFLESASWITEEEQKMLEEAMNNVGKTA